MTDGTNPESASMEAMGVGAEARLAEGPEVLAAANVMAGGGLGRDGFEVVRGTLSLNVCGALPLVNEAGVPAGAVSAGGVILAGSASTAPRATGTLEAARVGGGVAAGGPALAMAVVGAVTFKAAYSF